MIGSSSTVVLLLLMALAARTSQALSVASQTATTRRQHFGDVLIGGLASAASAAAVTTVAPQPAQAFDGAKVSLLTVIVRPFLSYTHHASTYYYISLVICPSCHQPPVLTIHVFQLSHFYSPLDPTRISNLSIH